MSGVGFQVSGKRNIEAETCWSEAAAGDTACHTDLSRRNFNVGGSLGEGGNTETHSFGSGCGRELGCTLCSVQHT